jgi:hypothetical protein
MTAAANTYARAQAGYDREHERRLMEAITLTIAENSRLADCNVMCLRTAEQTNALITVLAATLAMSPAATRSPAAIRHLTDEIGKRLRRCIAAAEGNADFADFLKRCFHGPGVGGRA